MLATPRRLLLALVALAVCTPVLADGVSVDCHMEGDRLVCSGTGTVIVEYPANVVVQTNVVGVCTNCVSISPSECESYKTELKGYSEKIGQSLASLSSDLYSASGMVDEILDEGDSFWPVQRYVAGEGNPNYGHETSAPQFEYVLNAGAQSTTSAAYVRTGLNSIANYYQEAVKPFLTQVNSALNDARSQVENISIQNQNINGLVSSINCSSCTASFDGDGGGGGGGGGSCSECPCKEQMEALEDLLKDDMLPHVEAIDRNVNQLTNLLAIAKDQLSVTKEGFHNVTNLFNRLDDYVLDDFSNKVFQIQIDVNYIASNLAAKVRNLFIDNQYSNSTFYTSIDGQKDIDIQHLDTQLITESDGNKSFDWGEYKDLTWFERIEFLMLHLSGIYSLTNAISGGTTNYSSFADSLESKADDLESAANEAQSGFNSVKTSFTGFVTSFKSAFGNHDAIKEINLIENYLGTQQPLVLKIDSDILDACRVITSLLWTALFSVVLFKVFVRFWVECVEWSRILIFDVTISFGK